MNAGPTATHASTAGEERGQTQQKANDDIDYIVLSMLHTFFGGRMATSGTSAGTVEMGTHEYLAEPFLYKIHECSFPLPVARRDKCIFSIATTNSMII